MCVCVTWVGVSTTLLILFTQIVLLCLRLIIYSEKGIYISLWKVYSVETNAPFDNVIDFVPQIVCFCLRLIVYSETGTCLCEKYSQ